MLLFSIVINIFILISLIILIIKLKNHIIKKNYNEDILYFFKKFISINGYDFRLNYTFYLTFKEYLFRENIQIDINELKKYNKKFLKIQKNYIKEH